MINIVSTNPFREIIPIPFSDELFENSHKTVMKTSIRGTSDNIPPLRRARKKEAARIELLSKELRRKLFRIVEEFPSLDEEEITGFYVETLEITFGIDKIRKTLGSLSGSANIIWKIKREYLGNVWHSNNVLEAKRLRRAAFGRMRSVIMKLKSRLEYLESIRKAMRLMPGIDQEIPIICIAGYPNVGKSSLVKNVTSATPEIGAYPFTTKKVTFGHLEIPIYVSPSHKKPLTYLKCQIVDTPGILDRPLDQRNEIELQALAALKTLATAIVFMFDYTQKDAIIPQTNLYNEIMEEFSHLPILLLFGKEDLLDEAEKRSLESLWEENFSNSDFNLHSMNDPSSLQNLLTKFFEINQAKFQLIMTNKNKNMDG
ncbi:MAG: GTPase [Candidatus Hodarchaeales archaeon]